jgi:hypothetical protein
MAEEGGPRASTAQPWSNHASTLHARERGEVAKRALQAGTGGTEARGTAHTNREDRTGHNKPGQGGRGRPGVMDSPARGEDQAR